MNVALPCEGLGAALSVDPVSPRLSASCMASPLFMKMYLPKTKGNLSLKILTDQYCTVICFYFFLTDRLLVRSCPKIIKYISRRNRRFCKYVKSKLCMLTLEYRCIPVMEWLFLSQEPCLIAQESKQGITI